MLIYWLWYAQLPQLQLRQKMLLLQHFSDPEDIYYASDGMLAQMEIVTPEMRKALENKDLNPAQKILYTCEEKGIHIVTYGDREYPSRLRYIPNPPLLLYYRGHLPDWETIPVLGIVGTRKASAYGLQTAMRLSSQIAACGALVISGGAYGVDTMAIQGAMSAGKPVVCVLGCGVDVVYPKSNKMLFSHIAETGCLISEYPPKTAPVAWHFPERNRIISGISNGVLVVEAPERSGALITATEAREQGRDVFVVPGNIDVASCAGSNALLQQGAIAVLSGWDVVREYEAAYPGKLQKQLSPSVGKEKIEGKVAQELRFPEKAEKINPENDKKGIDNGEKSPYIVLSGSPSLTEEERQILSLLYREPQNIDDILAQADMPAGKVLSVLTKLTLKGLAVNHPGRRIALK